MPVQFICKSVNKAYSSAFAEEVYRSNWRLSWQSPKLSTLVEDVNAFLDQFPDRSAPTPVELGNMGLLRIIEDDFDAWRRTDPKEFADRFARWAGKFREDLDTLFGRGLDSSEENIALPPVTAENWHHQNIAPIAAPSGRPAQAFAEGEGGPPRMKEPSHYRPSGPVGKAKEAFGEVLEGGMKAADAGMLAAAPSAIKAVGVGLGSVVTAGAAVLAPAAEVGLAGAGLLVEVVMSVAALCSVSSTADRLRYLKKMRDHIELFDDDSKCRRIGQIFPHQLSPRTTFDEKVHDLLAHQILNYIINKKEEKEVVKSLAAFTLGTVLLVRKAIKGTVKAIEGTKGVHRYKAAHWLAYHFCVCHCQLAMHMVAALTSDEEMFWLMKYGDYEGITGVLAEKMKST